MTLSRLPAAAGPGFLAALSIRQCLLAMGALCLLMLAAVATGFTWMHYETALDGRRVAIRQNVETAASTLRWAQGLEAAGQLTRAQAQALAIQALKGARYGGDEYFWINDMAPRMVMHPFMPALDGQDLSALKDPNGKALFLDFVQTVRQQGAGYVAYQWPRPGQDAPVDKLSYVAGFAPWDWVIGSGVYLDDLHADFMRGLRLDLAGLALACALVAGMLRSVMGSISHGLDEARRVARAIAAGDISQPIPPHRNDEIGALLADMRQMSDHLNQTLGEVRQAAGSVALASHEIASANADLSGRTERAAADRKSVV